MDIYLDINELRGEEFNKILHPAIHWLKLV